MRGAQYKLIREDSQDTELYDLNANPLEIAQGSGLQRNLIGDPAYDAVESQLSSAMNGIFGLLRCSGGTDIDGDLACDLIDNCVLLPDPAEFDADGDDYGNLCDADFDNTGLVTIGDFVTIRACFDKTVPASGPLADPTCSESDMVKTSLVNIGDFNYWRTSFLGTQVPGPACGFAPPGTACRGF